MRLGRPLVSRFWIALFALALIVAAPAWTAPPAPATFTVQVTPEKARPGEYVAVTVKAEIKEPWHVYSVKPVPPPGPEATAIFIEAGGLKPVGDLRESVPIRAMDPNFGKEVGYHAGAATFTQILQVPEGTAASASLPLDVTVSYMACTDRVCLPPRDVSLQGVIGIETGSARPEYDSTEKLLAATGTVASPPASETDATPRKASTPLFPFLLAAFGAGLLALVTPCVFPMIPVTLAFFTKQASVAGDDRLARRHLVRLAATYSLGIVLAFTAIGAVMAATVGAAGANQLAANPWVNLAFAALFVLFGLALLEVVELRLPSSLQGLAAGSGRRQGTLGVLAMGLAFVVAAFTCTAPFVGTVLVAAAQATTGVQWFRPIVGMAAFATALALPFFLLALFPGWLARLPRSGAWLTTVKGTFGFIELAAALKFLSNADMVWQWRVLTQPALLALWLLIALSAAAWLLGAFRLGMGTPQGRPTLARSAAAGAFAAIGAYCLWGLSGRPLSGWVVAFLPPSGYGLAGTAGTHAAADELSWHETLEAGLAAARAENRPVFIDFTGYTCTNCRLMEKNVFPDPNVRAELERFTRIRLYTDGGPNGRENQRYQERTFQDVALPLYAVLTPDGKPVSHVAGAYPAGEFAAFLKSARERAGQSSVATSRGVNAIRSQATQ